MLSVKLLPPSKVKDYKDRSLYSSERLQKYSEDELHLLHLHNLILPYVSYDSKYAKNCRTLCKRCTDTILSKKNSKSEKLHEFKPCVCSSENRSITVVLPLQEINYACQNKGFKLLYCFEIFGYKRAQKCFSEYFSILAHQKLKYSDIPLDQINLDDLNAKMDFKFKDRLELKEDDFKPDALKNKMVKMALCSFYGKLLSKPKKRNFVIVSNENALATLHRQKKIESMFVINENMVGVTLKPDKNPKASLFNNPILGSYFLSHCRQSISEKVEELLLSHGGTKDLTTIKYVDSDSCIGSFSKQESNYAFGEMKNVDEKEVQEYIK